MVVIWQNSLRCKSYSLAWSILFDSYFPQFCYWSLTRRTEICSLSKHKNRSYKANYTGCGSTNYYIEMCHRAYSVDSARSAVHSHRMRFIHCCCCWHLANNTHSIHQKKNRVDLSFTCIDQSPRFKIRASLTFCCCL